VLSAICTASEPVTVTGRLVERAHGEPFVVQLTAELADDLAPRLDDVRTDVLSAGYGIAVDASGRGQHVSGEALDLRGFEGADDPVGHSRSGCEGEFQA